MEVLGGSNAVLRVLDVVAPALTGAVVRTDSRGGGDPVEDPGPGPGELAEAADQHDGRLALAAAVEVEVVVTHGADGARRRIGAGEGVGGDVPDAGAHGGDGEEDQRDRHQPPTGTRQVPPHPDVRPHAQRQSQRRPHPREHGHRVVRGREGHQGCTGRRHRDRGYGGPGLGAIRSPGEDVQHRPAEAEAQQRRTSRHAFGGAREDHQGEEGGSSQSGGQRADDDPGDRSAPGARDVRSDAAVDVDAHGLLALAVVGGGTAVESGRSGGTVTPVRWPGCVGQGSERLSPGRAGPVRRAR